MVLILVGIFASYAFGCMIIICEFGQQMSNGFDQIDVEIEAFDWYLFPDELRRMLPIILMETQQAVEFKCFGSISANRENLKKVSFDSECELINEFLSIPFPLTLTMIFCL